MESEIFYLIIGFWVGVLFTMIVDNFTILKDKDHEQLVKRVFTRDNHYDNSFDIVNQIKNKIE